MMSALLIPLMITACALAQSRAEPSADEAERQERLRFMQEKAAKFVLSREASPDPPLKLKEEPVLRFSNPERDSGTWDGATFLWLEGARPVAALCFGIRRPDNSVFREHASFSNTPLVCRKGGNIAWAPQTGGLLDRPLKDAPAPAEGAAGRLAQMRALARRFSAACYYKEAVTQLRVLPQPLYRFSDEKQGILVGGLFALVVSNDAELLLLLEAAGDPASGEREWRFSIARMSSLKHIVRLDDAEIWSIPGYYTIPAAERKTGPYIEAFDGKYVASVEAAEAK